MEKVNELYARLRSLPFPVLGKVVGDFVLFDSLVAGCAGRVCKGGRVARSEVPTPDDATTEHLKLLRSKQVLSAEEREFLAYFELLDQLRLALLEQTA